MLNFYAGTLADPTDDPSIPPSEGIYRFEMDPETGALRNYGLAARAVGPSWVTKHPTLSGVWYAVASNEAENAQEDVVLALRQEVDGTLSRIGVYPSGGIAACHVSVSPDGKFLFVSNYRNGTLAFFEVQPDGSLGVRQTFQLEGQYGGSFENRVRFMNEVLDEVMLHAKDDMAVVVKTNMWDDCWKGVSIEEGIQVAKEIAKHKVHGIVLSGGTVSRSPMTILGGAMPYKTLAHYMPMKSFWWLKAALNIPGVHQIMLPTQPFKELYFMEKAKLFQEALKDCNVPLIYVGGVQSGDNCQQIMDEGFELFQIAHVLIKDPDFVKHVQENPHYHAGCGRSNYCVGRMYTLDMKCHECVERDGETIAPRIKREIAKLEEDARISNGSK